MFHDHSKHIDIWYHFIRDKVLKGAIVLGYVPSNSQVANILTKPLPKGTFKMFRERLNLVET